MIAIDKEVVVCKEYKSKTCKVHVFLYFKIYKNGAVVRRIKLIGYFIKHNQFITNVFEGRISGKRVRGHPRQLYFKDIYSTMKYQAKGIRHQTIPAIPRRQCL